MIAERALSTRVSGYFCIYPRNADTVDNKLSTL